MLSFQNVCFSEVTFESEAERYAKITKQKQKRINFFFTHMTHMTYDFSENDHFCISFYYLFFCGLYQKSPLSYALTFLQHHNAFFNLVNTL